MRLVFIGPQGCGKGTQAKRICEKFNLLHISTGDLLRGVTGDLRLEVDGYMNKGELVPDTLILKILGERLLLPDCEKGFILDGFPRNLSQAKALEGITRIDKFIEINISDEEAVRRISGRRNCSSCGRIYNVFTSPIPKIGDICDDCDVSLDQRNDDTEEAVKLRLGLYHNETQPILDNYPSIKINGEQEIEDVTDDIVDALK